MRDIEIRSEYSSRTRSTLKYLNPEQMNDVSQFGSETGQVFYTIIANQLQIMPPQDNRVLEMVYYQSIKPLTSLTPINWISQEFPDLYLFGLMVEINAFVKDAESKMIWDQRFKEAIVEIEADDQQSRWSGTPLEIRLG